jgi:hypothetical protein
VSTCTGFSRARPRGTPSPSGGARLLLQLQSGLAASGQRSGGNYHIPYDPQSGTILDYIIVRGLPDSPGPFWKIDPALPVSAPMVLLMGNADPRLVHQWAYLAAIAGHPRAPSALSDWFRIYEWRGATHRWADDEGHCGTPRAANIGPMGPFIGALLENARARRDEGRPEPQSRFAGHLDA